ncbi:Uncharacterized protein QTN25_005132 [Entamoeba marina]
MSLPRMYLMNALLYFNDRKDVISFKCVSKKCNEATTSLKVNPLLPDATFQQVKELFPSIQTYYATPSYNLKQQDLSTKKIEQLATSDSQFFIKLNCSQFKSLKKLKLDMYYWNVAAIEHIQSLPKLQVLIIQDSSFEHSIFNKIYTTPLPELQIHFLFNRNVNFEQMAKIISKPTPNNIQVYVNYLCETPINYKVVPKNIFLIDSWMFSNDSIKITNDVYSQSLSTCLQINSKQKQPPTLSIELGSWNYLQSIHLNSNICEILSFPLSLLHLSIDKLIQNLNLTNLKLNTFSLSTSKQVLVELPTTIKHLTITSSNYITVSIPQSCSMSSVLYQHNSNCSLPIFNQLVNVNCSKNFNMKYIYEGDKNDTIKNLVGLFYNCSNFSFYSNNLSISDLRSDLELDDTTIKNVIIKTCIATNLKLHGEYDTVEINHASLKTFFIERVKVLSIRDESDHYNIDTVISEHVGTLNFFKAHVVPKETYPLLQIKCIGSIVTNRIFPLNGISCESITFKNKTIQSIDLTNSTIKTVIFSNCEVLNLTIADSSFKFFKTGIVNVFLPQKHFSSQILNDLGKCRMGHLHCSGVNEDVLHLTTLHNLKYLSFENSNFRHVSVEDAFNLQGLTLPTTCQSLKLKRCGKLNEIDLLQYNINNLTIEDCKNITHVYVQPTAKTEILRSPLVEIRSAKPLENEFKKKQSDGI